jgi:hypothetical protein
VISARGRCINLIRGSRFSRSFMPPRGVSYARTPPSRSLVDLYICLPSRRALSMVAADDDERARHFIKKQTDDSSTAVDPHCLRAPAVFRANRTSRAEIPSFSASIDGFLASDAP